MKFAKILLLTLMCCAPLAAQLPNFTLADVAAHHTQPDCWMILNTNQVYNLTAFLPLHPAGAGPMVPFCGADGTAAFNGVGHSTRAVGLEPTYLIGNLVASAISVTLSPTTASLTTGQTQMFTANVAGSTQGVTWTATSIGTIDANGVFTAVSAGTGTVTATSVQDKTKSASATVTVAAPPPPVGGGISVTLSPTNSMLLVGGTQQFTAKVTGGTGGVTWTATGAVGTISSSGMFTATAAGSGVVKATSVDDPTKSASAAIMVSASSSCSVATNAAGFVVNCAPPTLIPGARYSCVATKGATSVVVRCTGGKPRTGVDD